MQLVPIRISVADFSKKTTTLPNGMLIGIKTHLTEVIVHLHQSATISPKERKEEDKSITHTVAALLYKQ